MDAAMPSPGDKRFVIATEPFMLLHFFSFGCYSFLVPQLTVAKLCHGFYNSTICDKLSTGLYPNEEQVVYDQATTWNSIIFAAVSIPSTLTILFIGALSDLVSKKKLLLLNPIIVTLQTIILILASHYMSSSMAFVAIAASLPSIYGDVQGSLMLAYSHMADMTEPNQKRTVRMNIIAGSQFLSLGLGGFLTGMLLQNYGYVIAFSLSLSASLLDIIYVAFFLPEAKKHPTINAESFKDIFAGVRGHLKTSSLNILHFVKKYLLSWKRKHVGLLLMAISFTNLAGMGEVSILVLFLKHKPLDLSANQIGEFFLALEFTRCAGVLMIAVICLKLVKPPDINLVVIGLFSMMATYVGISLSREWQILMAMTPLALAFPLAAVGIRSMLTKLVEPDEHGTVLSFVALNSLIAKVLATFTCNNILRLSAEFFPGLAILLLAVLCVIGLLLAVVGFYSIRSDGERTSASQNETLPLVDKDNPKV